MKKRILNGTALWVVKDSEYTKYVSQARGWVNGDEDANSECYQCVDRHDIDCPTFDALGLKRVDGVCNSRILNEEGIADFIAKRMENT